MKNIIIVILVIVVGVMGYFLFQNKNLITERSDNNLVETVTTGSHKVSVVVDTKDGKIFGAGDVAIVKSRDVLSVVVDGHKKAVFPDNRFYRIVEYKLSPDSKYLYILTGDISQDAAVRPYIYDIERSHLESVRLAGADANQYNGFPIETSVKISWFNDNRLVVSYNNFSVAPGGSESGPRVGLQTFMSISTDTPWFIDELN